MSATTTYSRKNPFPAALLANRLLTGKGSQKETRHFELGIGGSGFRYECGDSLGVFPVNCPEFVDEVLGALRLSGEEIVPGADGEPKRLRDALARDYHLRSPSRQFAEAVVSKACSASSGIARLLDPENARELEAWMDGVDVLDFLREHPEVVFGAEEFVATLRKLQPRLYSIASSPRVTPETIHLTVAAVRYRLRGRARKGVASTFLADRLEVGETIPVFLHSAKGFRMPEDPSAPMIMVGPGTGVAPFRAFLQDREASGAPGKSWLFFGDQRRATDFLYGDEFERMAASGLLARLDTAFSRDQEEKVYVQHRMLEHGAELWKWIAEEGAYFYVCGDAKRMAKDVDAALKRIAIERGGLSEEEATEFLDGMKRAKRYRRDVY